MTVENRLELCGAMDSGFERVLTPEALEFLAELEHRFGPRRRDLLDARIATRARLRAGEMLDFLADTRDVRAEDWHVAPAPPDLRQRWVEITGSTDRKMIINALNSGAAGLDRVTIKATVLIKKLPVAFEMDEILYELRDHSAGLNAGRWDYIFSSIKCFADRPEMVLPDRSEVTMTVPFMRAYTELLAATCHRRGAHAMGGMAALIPSRRDAGASERALEGVRSDKQREVSQGYDGTWVAHPDLVPTAREVFERGLNGAPNQLERRLEDVHVTAADLQD